MKHLVGMLPQLGTPLFPIILLGFVLSPTLGLAIVPDIFPYSGECVATEDTDLVASDICICIVSRLSSRESGESGKDTSLMMHIESPS